jgi:cobalamin biosynthesis protein CobT
VEEDCVILDIPEGVRLNLLGLVVQIDRVLITADRAGLLGGLLASLTCGGAGAADQLDALAQMVRAREIAPQEPAEDEEQAGEEEPAEDEEQAGEEEPAEDEEQAGEEQPAQPRSRRGRGGGRRA